MRQLKYFIGMSLSLLLILAFQSICLGFGNKALWQDITQPLTLELNNVSGSNPLTIELDIPKALLDSSKELDLYINGYEEAECDAFLRINDKYKKNISINRSTSIKTRRLKPGKNILFFSDKNFYGIYNIYELNFEFTAVQLATLKSEKNETLKTASHPTEPDKIEKTASQVSKPEETKSSKPSSVASTQPDKKTAKQTPVEKKQPDPKTIKLPEPEKKVARVTPTKPVEPSKSKPELVIIPKDTTPPKIVLTDRSIQPVVYSPKETIKGRAIDDSGVALVYINSMEALLDQHGNFQTEVLLRPGENTIVIRAVDIYRNTSEETFTITRSFRQELPPVKVQEDKSGPEIILLSHKIDGSRRIEINDKSILLKGKATDANGVVEVLVNDHEAYLDRDGNFQTEILLKPGENPVFIKAKDVYRNTSQENFTVTRAFRQELPMPRFQEDKSGPEIILESHTIDADNRIEISEKTVTIKGKAADSNGVVEVIVNDREASLDRYGNFSIQLYLSVGDNPILLSAMDRNANKTTRSFTIHRSIEPSYENDKRLALLIGNSNYKYGGSLANPLNDVRAMAKSLERLGFTVMKREDSTQGELKRAIDEFGTRLASGYNVGLFFYAGHGVQIDGSNYLIPVDANLKSENDVEYDCVATNRVLAKMEDASCPTNLVILDACRDNPFERAWSRRGKSKGLAFMSAPSGSLIAYATQPGNTASDGVGQNGLYTSALLNHIETPKINVLEMFRRVRVEVMNKTYNGQITWESTSLTRPFFFRN